MPRTMRTALARFDALLHRALRGALHIRRLGALCLAAGCLLACAPLPPRASTGPEFWGFAPPWDARSAASASQHGAQLDVMISGWITLDSASFRPVMMRHDALMAGNVGNRRHMAVVTSYHGARFHPETVRGIASDNTVLARRAGEIASMAQADGYRGLLIDFDGMTPDDLSPLRRAIAVIADSARARGIGPIGVAVPATDTAAYPARPLIESVDFVLVKLYDQHRRTTLPGPIAPPQWARRALAVRVAEVGASKLVAALPIYGYAWVADSAAVPISFAEAGERAALAYTTLERDMISATLNASWGRDAVWTSDAELLRLLVQDARVAGVSKFALWRLGLEDPRIWTRVVP